MLIKKQKCFLLVFLSLIFSLLVSPHSKGSDKVEKGVPPVFIAHEKGGDVYTLNEKRKHLLDENYLQLERDLNQQLNGSDRSFILHK